MLSERLLSIEWEPRQLPELSRGEPGSWLLLSACEVTDPLTAQLDEALNSDAAQCTTVSLPLGSVETAPLRTLLSGNGVAAANGHGPLKGLTGVVVVSAQGAGGADQTRRGRDYVAHLVTIARELSELPGESPRLTW